LLYFVVGLCVFVRRFSIIATIKFYNEHGIAPQVVRYVS
jgi:hypothetical protein